MGGAACCVLYSGRFGLALPFAGAQSGLLIYLLVDRRTSEILKRLVLDELCELNGHTTSFREVLMSTFIIQKGEARIGNWNPHKSTTRCYRPRPIFALGFK